jgi:hypothetical protein
MPAKVGIPPHLAIAHVLFIDVVGYSKLLVAEQRAVVEELNRLVRESQQFRKCEAGGKLIRIPAGDGMALVFFESPEQPAQCAVEIAKALKNHPQIRLRMGVHSGRERGNRVLESSSWIRFGTLSAAILVLRKSSRKRSNRSHLNKARSHSTKHSIRSFVRAASGLCP